MKITRSVVPSLELLRKYREKARTGEFDRRVAFDAEDRTDEFIHGPPGTLGATANDQGKRDPRAVMVVHGRHGEARRAIFDFLRALGLLPREWSQLVTGTGKGSPYVGEILEHAFADAQAVVVLFTGDDEACLREGFRGETEPSHETELTPQPRPNVLFEAGMAFGIHPDRTVLVELGSLRPISDLVGRHVVHLDGTPGPLRDLARRLERAGCPVDLSGDDWADSSRFPTG